MTDSKTTQVKSIEETEEQSVVLSGFLTNLQHRPLLPSIWRNRFWVLKSEGVLYCYRHASSKNHILRLDIADPSIRIRTGDPVAELKGVKWPRGLQNDRKLCILVRKKRHFYYTADSTHLSAWDEALHSVADKFAFNSNWTLGSQKSKLLSGEGPITSVQDMRGGDGRGMEAEDKEAILESYRRRKSVMARAQLATLFGAQPSPSLSRVQNFGDPDEMEPLSQRVQRLSDASSTVVTLKRRHSKSRGDFEKYVQSPIEEHGSFTFQPRPGSLLPGTIERQRKTSHSQPKPTQAGLFLAKKREEEEEEKDFIRKMERFRQLATQHELPMRTAADLQRISRKPQRIRIPDQFMRRIDTPPPSPPLPGPKLVSPSSNLASIKERMQPTEEPVPLQQSQKQPPQSDPVIPPPHAFLASKDVSREVILLQEESLNELKKVLSSYSGQELDPPTSQLDNSVDKEDDIRSEEYLYKKRPSFASKRMESIQVADTMDEVRPSQSWRRPVPSVPSKSPLASEAPFSFSNSATAVELAVTPPESAVTTTDASRSLPPLSSAQEREVVKGEDPSEEAKQDRVQKAVDWVSGEVEKLIEEILSLGNIVSGGQTQIEFGYLFTQTANKFDALTGILKTAKKLGIVSYDGEVLFQGVNDNTIITLLKGDIGNIRKETFIRTPPVSPRVQRAGGSPPGKHRKFGVGTQQYGHNLCAVCGKQVYQVEYVGATDKAFHRWCFRCCVCQVTLSPTNFATIADNYYCTVHYERSYLSSGGYRELEGHSSLPT
ncbi:hypothetical protein LOD99_13567 [Oopsacas minuta]|uniref:Uncharacterized protein n=1 Tax=Oopsacas minuta TaxID=111878 RepID=A0AAV7KI15_9METZ|nr:hypothetical protein LOD99_13567 [Oopsacas minuta]